MPEFNFILTAERLKAVCRDAAQRALDRASEVMDNATQHELVEGTAKEVYAAFLKAAGLDW